MNNQYRKKPVVIEAMQLGDDYEKDMDIMRWCGGSPELNNIDLGNFDSDETIAFVIHTLEGPLIARYKDWIIKGVKGEYYPCKPDIFEATYEKVKE